MEVAKEDVANRAIQKEVKEKKKEIANNLIVELNRAKPHMEDSKSLLIGLDFDRLKLPWHTLFVHVNPQFGGKTLSKNPCNEVIILVEREMKIKVTGSLANSDRHSVAFFFADEKALKAAKEKIYFKKMNNFLLTASLSDHELLYRVLRKNIDPKTRHDPSSVYSLATLARMKLAPLTGMTRGEQLKWKEFVAKEFYACFKNAYAHELSNLNLDEAGKTGLRSFFRKSKLPLEDERKRFTDNICGNCRLEDLQSVKGYTPAEFILRHELNLETMRVEQGIVLEHGKRSFSYTSIIPLMFVPYADTRIMQIGKLMSPFTSQNYTSNENVNYLVDLQRDYSGAINVIVREYVLEKFENRPLLTETKMKLTDLLVKGDNFFNLNWIQMHSYVYEGKLSHDLSCKRVRENSRKVASDLIWSRESVIYKRNAFTDALIELGELTSNSVLALAQFFKPTHLTNECSNRCDFSYECLQNLSQRCKKIVLSKSHLENYSALDKTKFVTVSSPVSANQTLFEMTSCLESRFARDHVTYFYTYADAIGNFYKSIRTCRPVKRIIYLASNAEKIEEYVQYAKYPSDADLFIPTKILPINLSFETLELNYLILFERKSFDDIRSIRIVSPENVEEKREEKHKVEKREEIFTVGKREEMEKRAAEKHEEKFSVGKREEMEKREENQVNVANKFSNFVPRKVLLNQGMGQKVSHPLPRKPAYVEEPPISRPEIYLQSAPKIDLYAAQAIYDSVKTIKQNILNRSVARGESYNNLRNLGDSTCDIFADLSTNENQSTSRNPQHSSNKTTDIFSTTEKRSDWSKSEYCDQSTSDIIAMLSAKEERVPAKDRFAPSKNPGKSQSRDSDQSTSDTIAMLSAKEEGVSVKDRFAPSKNPGKSQSRDSDQSTSDIIAMLSAKEERISAKDRFGSSKNLGKSQSGDSKDFPRVLGDPSTQHASTAKSIKDAITEKRLSFLESWNQPPPPSTSVNYPTIGGQLDFQNYTQPPPQHLSVDFSTSGSQPGFHNTDFTQPPPIPFGKFPTGGGNQPGLPKIDFTQPPPNPLGKFPTGGGSQPGLPKIDFTQPPPNPLGKFPTGGGSQPGLPKIDFTQPPPNQSIDHFALENSSHQSTRTRDSSSGEKKLPPWRSFNQSAHVAKASTTEDPSKLIKNQSRSDDILALKEALSESIEPTFPCSITSSENLNQHAKKEMDFSTEDDHAHFKRSAKDFGDIPSDPKRKQRKTMDWGTLTLLHDKMYGMNQADKNQSENGVEKHSNNSEVRSVANIKGDIKKSGDDFNIESVFQKGKIDYLLGKDVQRDINTSNRGDNLQRDNNVLNIACDFQKDIPNIPPNIVGGFQRDIPNILPNIASDIRSNNVSYTGNNIQSNDSKISTETQWDRISSIIGGGIGGNGSNILDIGGGIGGNGSNILDIRGGIGGNGGNILDIRGEIGGNGGNFLDIRGGTGGNGGNFLDIRGGIGGNGGNILDIGGGTGGNGSNLDISGGGISQPQQNTFFFNESDNPVADYGATQPNNMFPNFGNPGLDFGNQGFAFDNNKRQFAEPKKERAFSYAEQYANQPVESAYFQIGGYSNNLDDDNSNQFESESYFPPPNDVYQSETNNAEYFNNGNYDMRGETYDGGAGEECLYSRRSPPTDLYERRERRREYDPFE